MSKSLVITGVSGFIGSSVAREATRRGYNVTGLDRAPCHVGGIEFIQADIRDKSRIAGALRDKDYVVHLAAITSNVEFAKNPLECNDINISGFMNIIDAAAHSGCQKFVYASSAAVYVDTFCETSLIDFRTQANHYAKSKIMNEMMAMSYESIFRMKTIGLRYFNVYGSGENEKGDYASIITLFLKFKNLGAPLIVYGDGTQARDLINVTDVAQITLNLLENGTHDIYNVGTGTSTAYRALAEMIDKERIRYEPNPLSSYQCYTRAETTRLRETLSDYRFIKLEDGIRDLKFSESEPGERGGRTSSGSLSA